MATQTKKTEPSKDNALLEKKVADLSRELAELKRKCDDCCKKVAELQRAPAPAPAADSGDKLGLREFKIWQKKVAKKLGIRL